MLEKIHQFAEAALAWGSSRDTDRWGAVYKQTDVSLVDRAQERVGIEFPSELRQFYTEIREGHWFDHPWNDLEPFARHGNLWSHYDNPDIVYQSEVPSSTPLFPIHVGPDYCLLYALAGPQQGELFLADSNRLVTRSYFPSIAAYFDFHIEMAKAGHLHYVDEIFITPNRKSAESISWMTANGHPFAGDDYQY